MWLGPTTTERIADRYAATAVTTRFRLVGSRIGPSHTVRVEVLSAYDVLVSIDGHEDIVFGVGDVVEARARSTPIRFIEPEGALPFWDLLRQKAQLLPS